MERFKELLEQELLDNEELSELLDMVDCYKKYEDCGASGVYYGCTWYNIILNDDTEVSVYLSE